MQDMLFPALAGVIQWEGSVNINYEAIPRTCGGDPDTQNTAEKAAYYSPHAACSD